MGKPKQFTKGPSKPAPSKTKAPAPKTAEDFQSLADAEEDAGGKHRAGNPAKSARAFARALALYDQGIAAHPKDFDLAYNKARLELEVTQSPAVAACMGVELEELLRRAWESHGVALGLQRDGVDVRFNAAQVAMSLAEAVVEEGGVAEEAIGFLQKALELLDGVLGKQEELLAQQSQQRGEDEDEEMEGEDEGGVALDGSGKAASSNGDAAEQSVTVVDPTAPSDLLDTISAALAALTTLVSLVDPSALPPLGTMAQDLAETKAATYISKLPTEDQDPARFAAGLARATFIAAFADAQFGAQELALKEYIDRLRAFEIAGKDANAQALIAEAQARSEMVLSVLEQVDGGGEEFAAGDVWAQLTSAQESLSKAAKLTTAEAKERKAKVYESKGDLELLRYRLASTPGSALSEAVKKSTGTLLTNARAFYKGAADHGRVLGDEDVVEKGFARGALVGEMAKLADAGAGSSSGGGGSGKGKGKGEETVMGPEELMEVLDECVQEGLVDVETAQRLADAVQGV